MQYHFTARCCLFAVHEHHNKQVLCTSSAAFGVARHQDEQIFILLPAIYLSAKSTSYVGYYSLLNNSVLYLKYGKNKSCS